jgi:hypothetical protein
MGGGLPSSSEFKLINATVVEKNSATWCSEIVAGPIVSDQGEDMNFE